MSAVNLDEIGVRFVDLGIPIVPTLNVPLGKPVVGSDLALFGPGRGMTVFAHPIDAIWFEHHHEPEVAHTLAMAWIFSRIEVMAEQAIFKIERMYGG
jgi:hypothetical protein